MAGNREDTDLSVRKSRVQSVQNDFELLESLPPRAIKILKALGAGNTWKATASAVECSKSDVTYWKNKLVAMGALRLQCRDVFHTFALTPFGSRLLTGSERGVGEVVGLEDFAVKFVVLEGERVRIDWRKLGSPRNWVKLGVRIGDVRVVRTSRHVIIHPGRLMGFSTTELKVEAGRIIERTKMVLENRFGMVLSADGVPLHEPVYEFFSKAAREISEFGTFNVKGVGSINRSPPTRIPHEEYVEQVAQQRLDLPGRLSQLEEKLDRVEVSMSKLAGILERIFDLERTQPVVASKGAPDYVS